MLLPKVNFNLVNSWLLKTCIHSCLHVCLQSRSLAAYFWGGIAISYKTWIVTQTSPSQLCRNWWGCWVTRTLAGTQSLLWTRCLVCPHPWHPGSRRLKSTVFLTAFLQRLDTFSCQQHCLFVCPGLYKTQLLSSPSPTTCSLSSFSAVSALAVQAWLQRFL